MNAFVLPRQRAGAGDAALAMLLFLVAVWWGASYWRAFVQGGGQPLFYQEYFEPAVMTACGRGFVVSTPMPKPLEDFLVRRTDRFSCDQIPSSIAVSSPGFGQAGMRYLMMAVAATWRVVGISWSGLGLLCGVLFGATIAAAYGIFRLGMPRVFAAGASVALSLSTLHLRNAPHFRDYGKVPFALALTFLAGWLLRGRFDRRAVAIGAAYGVVLGIGYGFRSDLLVYIPLFLIALFGFVDGGPLRNLPIKASAAVAMFIGFVAAGWPIVSSVRTQGGCEWHVAILGFASPFDEVLGLEKPIYEPSYAYSDEFVYDSVRSYAVRQDAAMTNMPYCSRQYDVASRRFFFDLVTTLPADVLVRAYASIRALWDLPFRWQGPPAPGWHPWLYRARARALMVLAPAGAVAIVMAVLMTAVRSPRWAASLCLLLLYFGSYPAIQFAERHYFHLEFIGWWAFGAVAAMAIGVFRGWRPESVKTALVRAGTVVVSMTLLLAVPLMVVRQYQQRELRVYFQRYIDAPKVPVATPLSEPTLVEVDVDPSACGGIAGVRAVYNAARPGMDYSKTFALGSAAGVTRVFFPAYWGFLGVKASSKGSECVLAVSRAADVRSFPLMMTAVLAPGWERAPLYQRFR